MLNITSQTFIQTMNPVKWTEMPAFLRTEDSGSFKQTHKNKQWTTNL